MAGRSTRVGALRAFVAALAAGTTMSVAAQGLSTLSVPVTEARQREVLASIDAVGRRGFLYEVASPDRSTRLFLYGTVHLGQVGSEPFNAPLMQALRQSRRLALEADPSDSASTQTLALELGQYPDGDSLQRHLPPALMARVDAYGAKSGMPPGRIARLKPWLLANMVALQAYGDIGLDAALGSELYLSGFARGMKLPIVEIEGMEAQLRMLAALPDALQAAQLDEALAEAASDDAREQGRTLFDLWLAGDAAGGEALVAQMHRDVGDKLFERYFIETLLDRRNRAMADRAERYLDLPGDTFFAVGSLHLFGETGLIREFERRGYRVLDLQPPLATPR